MPHTVIINMTTTTIIHTHVVMLLPLAGDVPVVHMVAAICLPCTIVVLVYLSVEDPLLT